VCTWFFSLAFYFAWTKDDHERPLRRCYLFKAILALAISVITTLVMRPWISWPAPNRNPAFMALFPNYLWGDGTWNCFPSHSTLAYFTVATGFWPLRRDLSIVLALWTLICVSLPRVYLGGHYPIDILASMILGLGVLAALWRWPLPAGIDNWLNRKGRKAVVRNILFSIWMIELTEGFRISEFIVNAASRLAARR
jgi:membrane-associated phospholipid phosphatase